MISTSVRVRLSRDVQNGGSDGVEDSERHLASDIGIVGNAVPDIASAPASTKNRISNTPSWPKKRTAFLASSKLLDGLGKANVMIDTRVWRVSGPISAWPSALSDV